MPPFRLVTVYHVILMIAICDEGFDVSGTSGNAIFRGCLWSASVPPINEKA
jgi:hypothetical protein